MTYSLKPPHQTSMISQKVTLVQSSQGKEHMPEQPTILVVEQDPLIAEMLTDTLLLEGYHVAQWKPGVEHVSWVLQQRITLSPVLLIFDLGGKSFPCTDLERIAQVWPDKRFVLLTTHPATCTWLQLMGYAALLKPFHPSVVLKVLKTSFPAPALKADDMSHYDD